MVSDERFLQSALLSALLGVGALATVLYHVAVYEQPDTGGTSLAGLFFFFLLVVAVASIAEAVLAAVLFRWANLSAWARRLFLVGVAGAGLAAVALVLTELPQIAGEASAVGRVLGPVADPLFGAMWLFAFVGVAGTLAGFGAIVLAQVTAN